MNAALEYHHQVADLRQYLLPAMIATFGDKCADCGEKQSSYDIDHKRYAPDISMYDLQLLCTLCHVRKSRISGDAYLSGTTHCSTCTCYV